MTFNYEILNITVFPEDKQAIKRIAAKNKMTASYVARLLIADGIKHIKERNIFKMVVE
jgi:hypothetical protein